MRITLHREIPDDPQMQAQWNALVEQGESPEVFYTHQWALAIQHAYGSMFVPFLVLLYEDDKLVGIASLALDPEAKVAGFLAGTTADYCDFLSAPAHRAELVSASLSELARAGVRKIELANLPADSVSVQALRSAALGHGFRVFLRPAYLCAQVELGTEEARSDLKASVLRKSTFRRTMAKLDKEGAVALRNVRTWPEIEPILPEFFTEHVARFLSTGRISNIAVRERRVFLTELARLLSPSGWVSISQLTVGSRSIAWNYGFQFAGSWFWYQPTFEPAYESLSPGSCLLSLIVGDACDTPGLSRVDLGLGAEGYKERFANHTRATLHGTVTKSLSDYATAVARYEAAHQIARWPRVEALIREGRARLVSLQQLGPGLLGKIRGRVRRPVWSREEVVFYFWPEHRAATPPASNEEFRLLPLDLKALAIATIHFSADKETSTYLLRSAHRLRREQARGFVLLNSADVPVHFCWADQFDGFFMAELGIRLTAETPSSDLIFDCWTPHAFRGQGYYAKAIAKLAQVLACEGREPWIFSAERNRVSLRGIDRSGFERRYSLVGRRMLGRQRLSRTSSAATDSRKLPVAS